MMRFSHSYLLNTIMETITRFRMWEPRMRILLAVSGGPDSMALLHCLMELKALHGGTFGVIHLNHGLRPEADEEENFVGNTAKSLNLPFFSKKVDLEKDWPNLSIEEAGRQARYHFFKKILEKEGFNRIATAHHADDQAEQILMNLVRGCGTDGLSGIPAVQGKIVRPLIHIKKEELLSWLSEKTFPFREDASNKDLRFLRNRVRIELLPLLEKDFNPAIRKNLLQLSNIAYEEKLFWEDFTKKMFQDVLIEKKEAFCTLSMEKLNALMPALQARVLRNAIEQVKGNLLAVRKSHMESIQDLLRQKESKTLHLPGRIRLTFSSGVLEIRKTPHSLRQQEKFLQKFCEVISLPAGFPFEIQLPDGFGKFLMAEKTTNLLGINEILVPKTFFPLVAQDLRPGDRIRVYGKKNSKKILSFLGEKGMPYPGRNKRPVLMREGEILWVPGLPPSFADTSNACACHVRIMWINEKS